MIKTGGVNVAPVESEQVLLQHPDTVQAHVVGVPDQSKGEIVTAVIELRAGAVPDTTSILASAASGWPATRCRRGLSSGRRQNSRARRPAKSTSPGYARSWRLKPRHD